MKFYIFAAYVPAPTIVAAARRAEELGFHGICIPDHVFMPTRDVGEYPYSTTGRPVVDNDAPYPDPWTVLAAAATATESLQLSTSVYVLPLRHPLSVARIVGTVATLAPGRVQLGVGVGWQKVEYDVLGVPFEHRGNMADEAIPLLRQLWAPGPLAHEGQHWHFPSLHVEPTVPGGIPILVGGGSERAIARAVALGDGYIAPPLTVAQTVARAADVRQALRRSETRGDERFSIHARPTNLCSIDDVTALQRAGVDVIEVAPWGRDAGWSRLEWTSLLTDFANEFRIRRQLST